MKKEEDSIEVKKQEDMIDKVNALTKNDKEINLPRWSSKGEEQYPNVRVETPK